MDSQRTSEGRRARKMQRPGGRSSDYAVPEDGCENFGNRTRRNKNRMGTLKRTCMQPYIVVYIPHKGRTVEPRADDTIAQLDQLLRTVKNRTVSSSAATSIVSYKGRYKDAQGNGV